LEVDWNKRYRGGFYPASNDAHLLVTKFAPLMPTDRPVIDIAMGTGRDLMFLTGFGLQLYGLERSWEAVKLAEQAMKEKNARISVVLGDANNLPFKKATAGALLVFYFLLRKIMPDLNKILAPGGLLIYETFLKKQNEIDRKRNPEYLLDDGELISYFKDLELLFYEEGIFVSGGKRRAIARFVGRKR